MIKKITAKIRETSNASLFHDSRTSCKMLGIMCNQLRDKLNETVEKVNELEKELNELKGGK